MAAYSGQSPKDGVKPPRSREIRQGGDPSSFETDTISWHFHRLDKDHGLWGWDKLKAHEWKAVLAALVSFEKMTWAKLKETAGGRNHGTNHHSLTTGAFCKDAKDRLVELKLDEYDELFSLRLTNRLRLYGIRDGRVLRIVWHDPHHGTGNGAYPVKK